MDSMKNVPLFISLPRKFRNLLREMAAQRNLANPDQVISGAQIASKIICDHLVNLENEGSNS